MINQITFARPLTSLMILRYTDIRSYIVTLVFILLAIAVPEIFHQFHLAGPTYLPMHIFVLIAGFEFGWRAGLLVGLFTPLVSYALSGMPIITILPQTIIEISTYGLIAGILRQKFNWRLIWSLPGAIIAGRVALLIYLLIINLSEFVYSPPVQEKTPFLTVWSAFKQGWPGIVIQFSVIPAVIWMLGKLSIKTSWGR
jgi:hypothetical protein